MENFNRLVLDAFKQSFSEYVSTGSIDQEKLLEIQNMLKFELDRLIVSKSPTQEIKALIRDVEWLKYDLLEL